MDDEEYFRQRLHQEVERLSSSQIRNFERNENSFWSWIRRAAQMIWNAIAESWIVAAGKWLWGLFF